MTATNMCSNFSGKWDSPHLVDYLVFSQPFRIRLIVAI